MKSIISVDKNEINKLGLLIINNIEEGCNDYYSRVIKTSNKINGEDVYLEFFKSLFNVYCNEGFYVDFYINNLTNDEINSIRELLDQSDKDTFNSLISENFKGIYFKVSSLELVEFFVRLSTRELFFISFYTKDFTIWGNYDLSFPIFTRDASMLLKCFSIIKENDLYLDRINL
ncbi:MAG: hypothetical protein RR840_02100 [Clostridium sp.]